MNPPVLHNVCEAAKLVRKSPSWLYQKGAAGEIPRTKIGHNVFWTDEQCAQIIRDGAQQPKPRAPREQKHAQRTQPSPPAKAVKQRKRTPAPPANAVTIPQADRSVSRLYRDSA